MSFFQLVIPRPLLSAGQINLAIACPSCFILLPAPKLSISHPIFSHLLFFHHVASFIPLPAPKKQDKLPGHGSMFGHLSVALSAAVITRRVLVVDDSAPWPFALCATVPAKEGGCPSGFMTHYFAPLSSCSTAHVTQALSSLPRLSETEQDDRVVVVSDDTALPHYRLRLPGFIQLDEDDHATLLRWFAGPFASLHRHARAAPLAIRVVDAGRAAGAVRV